MDVVLGITIGVLGWTKSLEFKQLCFWNCIVFINIFLSSDRSARTRARVCSEAASI